MNRRQAEYYGNYKTEPLEGELQLITYSFNGDERSMTGIVVEKEDLIFLYEYRGKYVGTEFFISFSKASISYKLLQVGGQPQ